MNTERVQGKPAGNIRSVVDVMDAELCREGWTQEQLDESRLLADRHEELLAKGYTEAQIDADWKGKTLQEILGATGDAASDASRGAGNGAELTPTILTRKVTVPHG